MFKMKIIRLVVAASAAGILFLLAACGGSGGRTPGDPIRGTPDGGPGETAGAPGITSVSPRAGTTGTKLTFSAEVTGIPPFIYSWDFDGGTAPNTSNEPSPTVTLGGAGEYHAKLTVANDYGSDSFHFILSVVAHQWPSITSVSPDWGDPGGPLTFSAVVEGLPPFTYSWDFSGGATPNTSAEESPQVILGAAGIYTISFTATNSYGSDTYPFEFFVGVPRIMEVGPFEGAVESTVTLTATVTGSEPLAYEWSFGGAAEPNTSQEPSPEVTLNSAGQYNASLSISNSYGNDACWFTVVVIPRWHFQTVDSEGDTGCNSSLALDSSGNPHISYHSRKDLCLRYAHYDGSSWGTMTVDSILDGNVGECSSIVLDNLDQPYLVYRAVSEHIDSIKHAYFDGSDWHIQAILESDKSLTVGKSSLVLDSSGNLHIAIHETRHYDGDLLYVRWDGSEASTDTVDTGGRVGLYASLVLDALERPHIGYYDATNYDLKYAWHDGSSWHVETLDSEGKVGQYTSIALDSLDNPHISYYDETNEALKYAYYDGLLWHLDNIDNDESAGTYSSLAVDSQDHPHISYCDCVHGNLRYAHYDGSEWRIEVLRTMLAMLGNIGYSNSLTLDSLDHPHISCRSRTHYDLVYATYY